jgi:chromate transporter
MAMFETLVQLFAAFAKIGFTSFGGTSMIPLIMDEMSSHGWMTDADLTNLIAIAEMTPGSLGVNAATFAGTKTAGMLGGVFAVLGVLSPTLTLTLLAAAFFQKFRTSKVMSYIMKIVKPVCIGMVLGVLVGLCRQTCITEAVCRASPSASSALCCSRSSSSVCRRSSASRRCWGWCASGCFDLSVSLRSTGPGCGTQHPLRFACVLLAAAPTSPPCFRHWRRSSPLPLVGEPLACRSNPF